MMKNGTNKKNRPNPGPGQRNKGTPPPEYQFPKLFQVGRWETTALVDIANVKYHLALLRAFDSLRSNVEGLEQVKMKWLDQGSENRGRRWTWFVGRAVERFERWCQGLQSSDISKPLEDIMPPLDVMMVWHAYMLNPGWYAEDCARISMLTTLKGIGRKIYECAPSRLETLLDLEPSGTRVENWVNKTATPFDPLRTVMTYRIISCPICRGALQAALMKEDGTGYLQHDFVLRCPRSDCQGLKITRETLAVRKIAEDLARHGSKTRSFLSGTLRTSTTDVDLERGKRVKAAIMLSSELKCPQGFTDDSEEWRQAIMQNLNYSMQPLKKLMVSKLKRSDGRLIRRIFSAYTDDKMFSIDLVGAVLRQGLFVVKMRDLRWTEPSFSTNTGNEIVLQHAIARYHAFLDLMSSSPVSFFVPTLDIDLIWHTHQLMGDAYDTHCTFHVRRFVDHDDKVEETQLSSAFDITCRAWKARFDLPYIHCGCSVPGETIGQKLLRLTRTYTAEPQLIPPKHEGIYAATHPSDHNAIYILNNRHSTRSHKRHRKRMAREEQRGKDAAQHPHPHSMAFLVPIPIYPDAACVAATGSVLNNDNSSGCGVSVCAAGAGGCGVGGSCGSGSGLGGWGGDSSWGDGGGWGGGDGGGGDGGGGDGGGGGGGGDGGG